VDDEAIYKLYASAKTVAVVPGEIQAAMHGCPQTDETDLHRGISLAS